MSYTRSKNALKRRRSATSKSRAAGSGKSSARGTREKIPDSTITPSSGNVFEDIGFSPAEARNLQLRTDLMIALERLIERKKLTQAQAAKLFGVTQPRISDLVRGKINLFSVESLIGMLTQAGMEVTMSVKPAA